MEVQCLTIVDDPRKGKTMFALGLLACIYGRDLARIDEQVAWAFRKKSETVYERNMGLVKLGYAWAEEHIDFRVSIPPARPEGPMVVMNGNEAIGMGAIASGMELCAMYPITPATSVSHYLGEVFESFGGMVHQAEDEIAAVGVAIGASYAGKVAFTVTSGPGLALKTEFIGLAAMTEIPLVVVDAARRASTAPDQGRAVRPSRRCTGSPATPAHRHRAGDHRGLLPRDGDGAPSRGRFAAW